MKKTIYLFFAASILAVSCSSDDGNQTVPATGEVTYMPDTNGTFWVYDVPGSLENGRDSLYVFRDTIIANKTYKKFKTKDEPYGFYSGALNNNGVRKDGDRLLVTGSTQVSLTEDTPFNINITDLVIFKQSASAGETLGAVTGTVNQQYNGFPVIVDYTLTTKALADVASLTVNGAVYNNVKRVETVISIKISSTLAGITFPVVDTQDVVTSTQFYAENIGAVKTITDFTYEIRPEIASQFNIPVSSQQHQEELLITHNVD
jgi:hypothetical protein